MGVEGCSFGEMGVCEEVGGERNVAGKWLLLALFRGQRDKIKTEELVGVREIVRGEEDGGCVPRTGLGVSGRSWPVGKKHQGQLTVLKTSSLWSPHRILASSPVAGSP